MMKNKRTVFAMFTDWNRPGAKGKYGGVGWYRILNALKKIENVTIEGEYTVGGADREAVAKKIKEMGDIMFMKYVDDWIPIIHLITIKRMMGIKLVIDIDDDMFNIHPDNVASKWHFPGSEKNDALKFFIKNADHLVVSTEPLREAMSQFGIPITVIPNCVDTRIWRKTKPKKDYVSEYIPSKHEIKRIVPGDKSKVVIGWVSSKNHIQDVPVIEEAMKIILKKYPHVEFWAIGLLAEELESWGNVHQIMGTEGYQQFPAFLQKLQLDIAIAPIIDDKFNRSKSNIKWMEAAMCGTPCVASKVYPYEHSIVHGETGFLARTTENWVFYLSKLIEDEQLRKEMGKKAKEAVIKNHNIKDHLIDYVKLFETL